MSPKVYITLFYHADFQQPCWNPHQKGHFRAQTPKFSALVLLLRISDLRRRIEVHMPFPARGSFPPWLSPVSSISKMWRSQRRFPAANHSPSHTVIWRESGRPHATADGSRTTSRLRRWFEPGGAAVADMTIIACRSPAASSETRAAQLARL